MDFSTLSELYDQKSEEIDNLLKEALSSKTTLLGNANATLASSLPINKLRNRLTEIKSKLVSLHSPLAELLEYQSSLRIKRILVQLKLSQLRRQQTASTLWSSSNKVNNTERKVFEWNTYCALQLLNSRDKIQLKKEIMDHIHQLHNIELTILMPILLVVNEWSTFTTILLKEHITPALNQYTSLSSDENQAIFECASNYEVDVSHIYLEALYKKYTKDPLIHHFVLLFACQHICIHKSQLETLQASPTYLLITKEKNLQLYFFGRRNEMVKQIESASFENYMEIVQRIMAQCLAEPFLRLQFLQAVFVLARNYLGRLPQQYVDYCDKQKLGVFQSKTFSTQIPAISLWIQALDEPMPEFAHVYSPESRDELYEQLYGLKASFKAKASTMLATELLKFVKIEEIKGLSSLLLQDSKSPTQPSVAIDRFGIALGYLSRFTATTIHPVDTDPIHAFGFIETFCEVLLKEYTVVVQFVIQSTNKSKEIIAKRGKAASTGYDTIKAQLGLDMQEMVRLYQFYVNVDISQRVPLLD